MNKLKKQLKDKNEDEKKLKIWKKNIISKLKK